MQTSTTKPTQQNYKISNLHLTVWFATLFILVSIAYIPILQTGSMESSGALLQIAPAITSIAMMLVFTRSVRGLGWKLGRARWLLVSYALPIVVLLIAYGLAWLLTDSFYDATYVDDTLAEMNASLGTELHSPLLFMAINGLLAAILNTLLAAIFAIGEELGWRGFLVPALAERFDFTRVGFISGMIWAVYHYPFFIVIMAPRMGVPWWCVVAVGTVAGVALSFIMAWLRLRSGSFWTAVLFHATLNGMTQGFFENVTRDTAVTPYLTGDAGILLAFIWCIVAYYFWQRRYEL